MNDKLGQVVKFPTKKPLGRIMAIASGKGGVGKTFVAVTLARALSELGERVLLVDSDLGLANVDIQLGIHPDLNLSHVMDGEATLAEAVMRIAGGSTCLGGFDLLPGSHGVSSIAELGEREVQRMGAGITALSFSYDRILVDLSAGIGKTVLKIAADADDVLLVAVDEPASLTDGYAFVKLVRTRNPDARIGILANRVKNKKEADRIYQSFARACGTWLGFEPGKAGAIHEDGAVKAAIRAQMLLARHAPQAVALGDVETIAHLVRAGSAFQTHVATAVEA
ncbi:AAA family ATPase [Candidatus Phycosocius spiralis]|uniref:Site-determining protein n=1 Tax=Candidatus Phycosocius spiralis TaxID=2815099 RepID=A0ABQ4PT96_9PROT|nr:AAA family ATPase [Candidatus Phycosocius spiralis]GIU66232.1 site-determining protein [Candidatus Phycosocius spiralis]